MVLRTLAAAFLVLLLCRPSVAAEGDMMSALLNDYDIIAVADMSKARNSAARAGLVKMLETGADTGSEMNWRLVVRVFDRFATGEWLLGYNFREATDDDQIGFATARTTATEEAVAAFIAGSGIVNSATTGMRIRVKDGNLIVRGQDAKVYSGAPAGDVTVDDLLRLKKKTSGEALFVYVKPKAFLNTLTLDTTGFGLDGCTAIGLGLGRDAGGEDILRIVLEGDLSRGLAGALFSPAKPLECLSSLEGPFDVLLGLTLDGSRVMGFLREYFKNDTKTLDEAITGLNEATGVSVEELLNSLQPEELAVFTDIEQFGADSMTIGNLGLLKDGGFLAFKTKNDLLQRSIASWAAANINAGVTERNFGDVPTKTVTLLEVDDVPIFQAFLGRKGSWTLGAFSDKQMDKAARALSGSGAWAQDMKVRRVFGGPLAATSGFVYADLPPDLAWPLISSIWEHDATAAPETFKTAWGPLGFNILRGADGLTLETRGGNLLAWLGDVAPIALE